MDPKTIFERFIHAGITQNADAQADMFTEDGILEAPLVPPGSAFPARTEGREQIRTALTAYHQRPRVVDDRRVNVAKSQYTLHVTTDPDIFIVEIDTTFDTEETMSLIQIYRTRNNKITHLRDYFAPQQLT